MKAAQRRLAIRRPFRSATVGGLCLMHSSINGHKLVLLAATLPALLLAGCVWQSEYDKAQQENQQLQAANAQLQSSLSAAQAQITRLQSAVKYSLNSDLLFNSGGWELSDRGQQSIAGIAKILAPQQVTKVVVNGYTDNAPIGPGLRRQGVTSNLILSQKRAESVMQFMISQGVRPEMVSAVGHGDADPVASNRTPQGRAQNRRVEITAAQPGA
jgi:chemotaxis protein MotB